MRAALALLCVAGAAGCGGTEEPWGTAELDLVQAPADAACLVVTAWGGSRVLQFRIGYSPGETTTAALSDLPTGAVVFGANAYAPSCTTVTSSTPRSWFAVPKSVQVPTSGSIALTLTFYR
jgi:hypothetical protein